MTYPILFVDHAPGLGGAEHSLLLLMKHLDRSRFAPHLLSVGGPLAAAARDLGVSVHVVALPRLRRSLQASLDWVSGAGAVARVAREIHAAALIANTVRAAFYAAPASRLVAHCPFVWYMRDFWLGEAQPGSPGLDRLGKRLLCGLASGVIANSQATGAQLPCLYKVVVIHNGIEVERFDPQLDGSLFRLEHDIPVSAPVAGMVGRLRPWKGQDRFLRVLARAREALPNLHGLIVGGNPFGEDDDYARSLAELATKLGIDAYVHFTGQIDDPRPALAAMDVFIHPGAPEPFGLVNVEAMAMAKPVVAFAHGALPEIVVCSETGLLVPPGDEVAMAAVLGQLLSNGQTQQHMGQTGRERAQQHFDVRTTVRQFQNFLDRTLGK